VLVETSVVVALNGLDVLEFGEHTEGVGSGEQLLKTAVALQTFDDEHDVVNLVAVKHLLQEGVQGIDCLTGNEEDFLHQFVLHGFSECLHLEISVLGGEDVAAVVRVLQHELELAYVRSLLQLRVLVVIKEAFAHCSTKSFGISVVNVGVGHFHTEHF